MVTETLAYRLRTSGPQARADKCETSLSASPGEISGFVMQTFKAEKIVSRTCEDKSQILCSTDMIGLGGNYVSASYSAQRFLDPDTNEIVFQASETFDRIIIEETEVPGASEL